MKILLDAHMAGSQNTGIGRYIINLNKVLSRSPAPKATIVPYRPFLNNGLYRIIVGFNLATLKHHPDILHASTFAPYLKTCPVVLTVHDLCHTYASSTYSTVSRLAFSLFFKRSLSSADAVICPSYTVEQRLHRFYPFTKQKTTVIYEAPDPVFGIAENKTKIHKYLRKKFRIDKPYFLVVGDVRKRKKPLSTIQSFIKAFGKKHNVQLVFAGSMHMDSGLFAGYREYIQSNTIRFLGYVPDQELNMLYNDAMALVYNSCCEGFGLPLVEAMKCKTAIMCSDLPVFREIALDSCLYFKNRTGLSRLMCKAVKNKLFLKRYANRGYRRSALFSWRASALKTHRVYQKILPPLPA